MVALLDDGQVALYRATEPSPPIYVYAEDADRIEQEYCRRSMAVIPLPHNAVVLRPLGDLVAERRGPEWLLLKTLECGVIAVMAGPRGTFKSFISLDWMMRAALAGHGVVILSGEGGGLDRRADAWMRVHAPDADIASLRIVALERPVNLCRAEMRVMVATAVAALPWEPNVVMIDTLSKFAPGLKENNADEVSELLYGLTIDLRDYLKCTVLLVTHTGHDNAHRPRGSSTLMCNPDAEYIVSRPDPQGMTVTVSRDRFKDTASLPPLAYTARVIDLGRVDKYGDPVTSLVLDSTDPPPTTTSTAKRGRNQDAACAALSEWCRANPGSDCITTMNMKSVLSTQHLKDRRRRKEIVKWLTVQRIITPAVGGFAVDREVLK